MTVSILTQSVVFKFAASEHGDALQNSLCSTLCLAWCEKTLVHKTAKNCFSFNAKTRRSVLGWDYALTSNKHGSCLRTRTVLFRVFKGIIITLKKKTQLKQKLFLKVVGVKAA